jgi:hypothetical protein
LPPLHPGEYRNRVGNLAVAEEAEVFAENFCRLCFVDRIRRRLGLGSVKKDADKFSVRSQSFGDAFGISRPSPWMHRAEKCAFVDKIKAASEIGFEKLCAHNFAVKVPERFLRFSKGNR